jgi:hypothetical protein
MKRYHFFPLYLIALLSLLAFIAGCATPSPRSIPRLLDRPMECQEFLERLDKITGDTGAKNAAHRRVPGFPYLRTNRFLSALQEKLDSDEQRKEWVEWMLELDLSDRKKETLNLPDEAVLALSQGRHIDRDKLYKHTQYCCLELFMHDQTRPDVYEKLSRFVSVPDEYVFALRVFGLYPLVYLPVNLITYNVRERIKKTFKQPLDELLVEGHLTTYCPPADRTSLSENEIQDMFRNSRKTSLRVPRFSEDEEKQLVEHFAPVFIQDVNAPYDMPGEVAWGVGKLTINSEKPTVYYFVSHAFLKGVPIFQIVYVIWYTERAGKRSPLIERGPLDGMMIRISFDSMGRPFMVDGTNGCGCYHFFAPKKDRIKKVIARPFALDPFVPQWLPEIVSGTYLGIRINSGWHQVERLCALPPPSNALTYELVPYDRLESIPKGAGLRESMFDTKGIARGSHRIEPYILFSSGIPSIGSMRQRGHHAIELTDRVHFDDPYLFDENFIFK